MTVVVFPFVPVMPTRLNFREGLSWKLAAMMARAYLDDFTLMHVTPAFTASDVSAALSSYTMAAAPFCTAFPMNACPSEAKPLTATNIEPGLTFLESDVTSVISVSRLPLVCIAPQPSVIFLISIVFVFSSCLVRPFISG